MLQEITLNIRHDLPEWQWQALDDVYRAMPGFVGYSPDCDFWRFGQEEGMRRIWASVEPGGLHLSSDLDAVRWEEWLTLFLSRASTALGWEVGDAER